MNLIKKTFIAIITMLSFLPSIFMAFGQPFPLPEGDPRRSVVGFFFDTEGNVYNPIMAYGNTIRYRLPDPNLSIQYIYEEFDADILIAPLMRRAAAYWNNVLYPYFTIREFQAEEQPNFILQTMVPTMLDRTRPDYYLGHLYAITAMPIYYEYDEMRFNYGITSPGIYFVPTVAVSDRLYDAWETAMGNDLDLGGYAEIYTYALVLHEMGHALGLGHPDDVLQGVNLTSTDVHPIFSRLNDFAAYRNLESSVPQAPVMLEYPIHFLLTLHQQLDRPVNINNIAVSEHERRLLFNQVSGFCERLNFKMSSNSTEFDSLKADCDYNIVHPLAKTMVPIVSILLSNSTPKPKPKVKICTVELKTTDKTELIFYSQWYTTFTRKDGCQVNLSLKCDGSESACSSGDYSSHNKYQLIIYDDQSSNDEKLTKSAKGAEKNDTMFRITNFSSTNNMKFENKGSGIAKISYVDSSCYYSTGPSFIEIKPDLDRAFTVETNNGFFSACTSQPKVISWKIEYITYE
ncbi:hypothetical protein [Xenorhabdus cabanillasii]|uniref:Peptidase M10 metallopeptidase domain-containing protein n=1 Tax=Xenorhabdus cabanillasii JM26 TaxID=1427517 RepID=W1JBR6_9GAMM|nr:hypothetical protein [Xenorhabdus cabanillasii]PHM76715.1 hypothetical protein Xcab_02781 [Xenorhabdus cabanillasii JM26]CDL86985.1 exported hypothetical protein [Xenorhabdus cabanillasii JM26]